MLAGLPTRVKVIAATVAVLALVGTGLGAGYYLFKPAPAKPETYAPAVRQADNSLVLERKPDANAKPAQELPKGAALERVASVTVKPRPAKNAINASGAAQDCPPATVDLSLVRMPDNSRRIVASSADGDIVGGVDIPVESALAPVSRKWAAGVYMDTRRTERGVFLERDFGRVRAGIDVGQVRDARAGSSTVARVRVGFTF